MKTRFVIYVIILSLASPVLSQGNHAKNWTYIATDSTKQKWGDWAKPDWLRYFGLDAGDMDRDGDLDILSGRYLYRNPGGDMERPWERIVLDDNVDGIFIMDVDDDPFCDLIAQALPTVYWYEALDVTATVFQKHTIATIPATSHVNSQGFEKTQVITGGKPEILIAGNGDIYCIEIPSDPEHSPWKTTLIGPNTSDEGIGTGDIDGDGDTDVVAGRRPDGEDEPKILVWFENPGHTDGAWTGTEIGNTSHPIDRIEVADLNGDDRVDIVLTEERYPGLEPDAFLHWFEQPGNPVEKWERHTIVQQYSMNNLDLADLDHDGDIDIVTNEHKGNRLELQLWENDGIGRFTKQVLDTGKENHLGTQLADLDGDGDLDLFGAAWDNYKWMHLWRNDELIGPKTGQVFREYTWTTEKMGIGERFLRVGGKLDYRTNEQLSRKEQKNGWLILADNIDLENATGAELIIDRVQSHGGTKDLEVQAGNSKWLPVPPPSTVSKPKSDHMFHHNARVNIPLEALIHEKNIRFRMRVAPEHPWNWPQNLIYSVVLKIRYADKTGFVATVIGPPRGEITGTSAHFELETDEPELVEKVEYFGKYLDADLTGNGLYADWKLYYREDKIKGLMGQSKEAPFDMEWDTEWIPDQHQPVEVMARVHLKNGLIYLAPLEIDLILVRDYAVNLIQPYAHPSNWVTREDQYSEKLWLNRTKGINEAIITWSSWSPCYNEGILLNGGNLGLEGTNTPCYDHYIHNEKIDPSLLKKGENTITTLKTPLHNGNMVHGMEVQWPGIMVKVKYEKKFASSLFYDVTYQERSHYLVKTDEAHYYYDKQGGGFSRIIDPEGNDWIGFKKEPWNEYPASAASSYRGLPNLVFGSEDEGAGHPGFDKCTSQVIDKDQVRTESLSGSWAWNWKFYPNSAVLTMEKLHHKDPYWFLYEGTPAGAFQPDNYFYGTDKNTLTTKLPDYYAGEALPGDFKWIYCGAMGTDRVFFIAQKENDELSDLVSYLGNSDKGISSEDGMTVFGFGRTGATPLLTKPNEFVIGFMNVMDEGDIPNEIYKKIRGVLKE